MKRTLLLVLIFSAILSAAIAIVIVSMRRNLQRNALDRIIEQAVSFVRSFPDRRYDCWEIANSLKLPNFAWSLPPGVDLYASTLELSKKFDNVVRAVIAKNCDPTTGTIGTYELVAALVEHVQKRQD